MERLREIAKEATGDIAKLIDGQFTAEQSQQIGQIVEQAVIKGMLEGQHRAVDAALHCPESDQDLAHKIATNIRRENDALIANLSSMR